MNSFNSTLMFAGIDSPTETTEKDCSLWTGTYLSPAGTLSASLLQVRTFTSVDQLRRDLIALKPKTRHAVISARSSIALIQAELSAQGFTDVMLEHEYLAAFAQRVLGKRDSFRSTNAYIEPTLQRISTQKSGRASLVLGHWIREPEQQRVSNMAVILAPAGFGKTTFARHLASRHLQPLFGKRIPVFIWRNDWLELLAGPSDGQASLKEIIHRSILRTFPTARIGSANIDLLIPKGAIVPIFDGLDELCTDLFTEYTVSDIIGQLQDLLSDDDNGVLIVTSRTLYWQDNVPSFLSNNFEHFSILPFDSSQRQEYLEAQLDNNGELIDKAKTLLDRVEQLTSIGATSTRERFVSASVRFSLSPYIVYLATVAAVNAPDSAYSRESLISAHDPLDGIVSSLCSRDVDKIGVSQSDQIKIILSLSLLYGEYFTIEQLSTLYHVFDINPSSWGALNSHHIFMDHGDKRGFLFYGLSDYLRAKGISHWLYLNDKGLFGVEEYFKQIRTESEGSIDIFSAISNYYLVDKTLDQIFSGSQVQDQLVKGGLQGLMLIYAKSKRVVELADKVEISNGLSRVFLRGDRVVIGQGFEGEIFGFDLSDFKFVECIFKNVVFRNCEFSGRSSFERCKFKENFACVSCENFGEVSFIGSDDVSEQAKAVFAQQKVKGAAQKVTNDTIIEIFKYILRQFRTASGLQFRDVSREGVLSRAQQRNAYLAASAVDALQDSGVLSLTRGVHRKSFQARVFVSDVKATLGLLNDGIVIGNVKLSRDALLKRFG